MSEHTPLPEPAAPPPEPGPSPEERPAPRASSAVDALQGDRLVRGLGVAALALALLGLAVDHEPVFPFQGWIGFYGLAAFAGAVGLALGASVVRNVLGRDGGEDG